MSMREVTGKLALGTVQFGLPYGIANQQGQVGVDEVGRILDRAREFGVDTLDTAIAYGESERVLGEFDLSGFKVVTKLSAIPDACDDVSGWVERQLAESLARLGLQRVDAVLLHRPAQLLEPQGDALYAALAGLREQGLAGRIGASVYDAEELERLCQRFALDLVQAPYNIIDHRLDESGWLQRLSRQGTALHVRSVFLQGLLLMSREQRPAHFEHWQSLWDCWDSWLEEHQLSPLQATLRYALNQPLIERVVVGVDSAQQWQQILQAAAGDCPPVPAELGTTDPALLNPALWKTA